MSASAPIRANYRRRGSSDKRAGHRVEISLPATHLPILDLARQLAQQLGGGFQGEANFLGQMCCNELERWFEDMTEMRLGAYLALRAAGKEFEFKRVGHSLIFREKVIVQ